MCAALVLAACSPATSAAPTADPYTSAPTAAPVATNAPATAAAPATKMTVEVKDQEASSDNVTIASVVATEAGWIVIHIDADGKPGAVIGNTAVKVGENKDVKVKIDTAKATPTLHAMLHVDKGVVGIYEFPGADVPAKNGDAIVMTPFKLIPSMAMALGVKVSDQGAVDGNVTVASVVATEAGWIVIHIDADGKPGAVIGNTAVKVGENKDVKVKIDTAKTTPTLHAMLHVDKGVVSVYEFPGADVPVKDGDKIVMTPFKFTK